MRKTILATMRDLILDDGYTSYDKLPDDAQHALAAAMAADAKDHSFFEVLTESNKSEDNVYALIVYLRNGDTDSALHLAETLRANAMSYFENSLREAFDDLAGELECERKREAGLTPIVDRVNGEVRWIR